MRRTIIIALIAIVLVALAVIKLASNKAKINKETSYKEVIANVPVNVNIARNTSLNDEIKFVGIFRPSKEASVSSQIAGKIVVVSVNEGDLVREGQVLAELDQALLLLRLQTDEAQYAHSKEDLGRYENLIKRDATSDISLKQTRLTNTLNEISVKNTKEELARCEIKAPISGYLTEKNFEPGTVVSASSPIGKVTAINTLKFSTMVPEYQVIKFALNQRVTVTADVFPSAEFTGTITQIAEKGDDNHNYKIEVLINNNNRQFPLKAGMNGTMKASDKNKITGIFIPREALVGTTENPEVYIAENNKAVLKEVVVGITMGNSIQISHGVNDGDKVIVTGMNKLKDERTITIASVK